MPSPALTAVSWVFALFFTLAGLIAFCRGIAHMWRQIRAGHDEPGRLAPVGRRLWQVFATIATHREFKGRPLVKAAHWLVMVSFVVLFFTLIAAYAHLRDPHWALPLVGHFPPWQWLVEAMGWLGIAGIIALMRFRSRAGRGSIEEAALSGDGTRAEPETPPTSAPDHDTKSDTGAAPAPKSGRAPTSSELTPASPIKRDGSPQGMASRFLGSTYWQARFVEWVILIVCLCVVILSGLDAALAAASPETAHLAAPLHHPTTWWMAFALGAGGLGLSADALANTIVCISLVKIAVSMTWMMVVGIHTSMGIAWHRFTAFLTLYSRRNTDGTKSLGPAAPMIVGEKVISSPDDFDDLPEDATLGIGTVADFSWRDRLDLYACTECGRCQELCPAWNTQKPLSPKLLVMAMRDHMESASNMEVTTREVTDAEIPGGGGVQALEEIEAGGQLLVEKGVDPLPHSFDLLEVLAASGATGPKGVDAIAGPLVPGVVSEEVLWDCTMCGACVEQCPVDIEHIDHVLDLRRHQVLMESAFPRELGKAFRSMESKGNPYNQSARKRMDWAKGLDFDVPVIGQDVESADEVEWLYWVGCAGAFDDRAKATSAAIAELLYTAGVSFAVLGGAESCTGDAARRAGNEPLFQMLASAAIDTLTEAHARKIVVSCAHCFNTIAGEFPQLGGHFEVVHHTQLLSRLVRDGLLKPVAPPRGGAEGKSLTVTYHDACFLGRHNRVYEPPRELVGALPGVNVVEMPRNQERAMCCGAGGAHAWFEETRGVRIADARIAEAAGTGADIVATACPFCTQMLGGASGASAGITSSHEGGAALPEVKDVAIMLLESVRRGENSTDNTHASAQ
ncbi:MAG: (Fe-S)-binding protein [Actinomycetaceae bacterium]|nr:(Fe-S)-binding protein [Actinomycetaceae bacterium]